MKNKKVLIAVVAAVLVIAIVLGVILLGGKKDDTTPTTTKPTTTKPTTTTTTSNPPAPGPVDEEYTLGMGAVAGGHNMTQTNLTVATVVVDANGVIVACRLDVAQNKYSVADDVVTFTVLESKKELGDRYNMAAFGTPNVAGGTVKEWYEQAQAFENYVVGKTAEEVAAMTTQVVSGHNISDDEALLNAGCTIDITDFKAAVVKACNDDQAVTFTVEEGTTFTLGLALNSANDGSTADDEENYTIKLNVEFAASVVIDGKIAATLNDAYQPVVTVEDGEVVSANFGKGEENGFKTKRELREAYGMGAAAVDKNGDGISLEWYLQSLIYSEYVVGKTAAELAGFFTAGDDLLTAGCTIYIGGISTVVAESAVNAAGSTPVSVTYTLGMGVAFGSHTVAQTNATVATVVVDANGVIVACRLDCAQNKYSVADDEVTFSVLESKVELGDRYNMAAFGTPNVEGGTVKEWYLQAQAFENYVVGKTAEEVAAMTTQVVSGHNISDDEALLNAGCTIDITDFKAAVVKACNDDQAVTFTVEEGTTFTLGLALNSENDGSTADDEENYTIKLNVEFAASVVVDGKIAASLNDAYQPVVTVEDGEVVSANVGKVDANYQDVGLMSKRELKEYYMMAVYGANMDVNGDGKVLEWYVQSAAFSAHVVGMTGTEVADMETAANSIGYQMSTDADLLNAGCTIQITGLKAVVAESVANAR